MGTIISNLKARFGVDTADFRKGLKDGEKALTDFKEAGSSQIADFASLFGINMSAVSGALSTVGKALNYVGQSFKAARTGGDAFAISMKGVRAAMMATGIGALIVALGSLIAYFKETEKGSLELAKGLGQLKGIWEVVKDRAALFGQSLFETIFRGNPFKGWELMKETFRGIGDALGEAAYRGKETAQMVYDLNRQERQFSVTKSEQLVLIDQLRLKSRDLELTAQERLDALTRAAEIEKRFNREAIDLASQKILIAQANLQNDQDDEELKNALAQAYVEYNQTLSESIQFEYSLTRQKNALIKEIRAQLEAQKELNQASKISGTGLPGATIDTTTLANMPSWQEGTSDMQQFGQAAIDMGEMVNDSLRGMVAGMGEWFGAFASGMATVRDGRQMVGNALGDMLITLGRVAINTGIGIEAIKKAFASLGGIGAIAAGTALIAFGSSIKGSIASINQSRTSAMEGTSIPGSAGSIRYAAPTTLASAGNGTLKIEGTARLVMSGADLLAILNNENTRINIVT